GCSAPPIGAPGPLSSPPEACHGPSFPGFSTLVVPPPVRVREGQESGRRPGDPERAAGRNRGRAVYSERPKRQRRADRHAQDPGRPVLECHRSAVDGIRRARCGGVKGYPETDPCATRTYVDGVLGAPSFLGPPGPEAIREG